MYKIVPRENHVRNLPLSLMLCENKDMLRDRVQSLRKANIYNIHTDRHLVSAIRVVGESNGDYQVEANYAVFQTRAKPEFSAPASISIRSLSWTVHPSSNRSWW